MISQRARRGWEALPKGREGSGVPPEWPGGVRSTSWWARSGREALLEGPVEVRRPFRRVGWGREALPKYQEGSGGPPGGPGGVGMPSQSDGSCWTGLRGPPESGREALSEGQEGSR